MRQTILGVLWMLLLAPPLLVGQAQPGLENGFAHPPASARPLTWWHWINGNVSREGILADMQAMKRAGLAGVQMVDVSMYIPQGSARYGSDEWYADVRYAIQTAHQLGLSFGVANGPGWSGSGGPWVTPDMAMQHVVWSETTVDGGRKIRIAVQHPAVEASFYRDIAVIAVPADEPEELQPILETTPVNLFTAATMEGADTSVSVTFRYSRPVERQTLELRCREQGVSGVFTGEVDASEDGEHFQPIRRFDLRGTLGEPSLTIALPATTAKVFRVRLDRGTGEMHLPALASMTLSRKARLENFRSKTIAAALKPVLASEMPDAAAIRLDQAIPLTEAMAADGTLEWNAPAGRWTILRFGYTPTGANNHPAQTEGTGFEIDKMSAAAAEFYFNHSLGRILKDAGPLAGTTFNSILIDSWECGQQNWTAKFPSAFRTQRGYELEKYLPVLTGRVLVSPAASEAFLRDFRQTISELVVRNYYGTFRRLAEARRLALYAETYDGINFNQAEAAAQSGVLMTEFWAPPLAMDRERIKSIASVAHTSGRSVVAAEAFTGQPDEAKWFWTPQSLKPIGDAAFASGVNRFVMHSYVHQPRSDIMPGYTLSRFGTQFGRLDTWWPQASPWLDYTARTSYLLQQGAAVADVLALHPDEMDMLQPEPEPELPPGYAFDWVTPSILLAATDSKQGIRLAHGGLYQALVLPKVWTADIALLRRIQRIAASGIPVLGERPLAPTSLRDVERIKIWQGLVDGLWPAVQPLDSLSKVLASRLLPDVQFDAVAPGVATPPIAWTHRRLDGMDLYFLANHGDSAMTADVTFRSGNRQPELWNAVTAQHSDAAILKKTPHGVEVPLRISAGGSVFVVFRREWAGRAVTAVTDAAGHALPIDTAAGTLLLTQSGRYSMHASDGSVRSRTIRLPAAIDLTADWKVRFQPPIGAAFEREFHALHDFTRDADEQVRYFSGVATYRRSVQVTSQQREGNGCRLELGEVHDIAAIRVNGHVVPTLWTRPFAFNITPWLRTGSNTLEIEVTDRWVNRMVGDEHLPADAVYALDGGPMYRGRLAAFPDWLGDPAKTAARQRTTFATWKHFDASSPLVPAGLEGPVRLEFYRDAFPRTKASGR